MNMIASIFNLGGPDLIIILLVVLVIFGPKKLPELARGLRQAMDEFNKAKHEVERELTKPTDVTVQAATGQQPRQPVELPPAPVPAAQVQQAQAAPAPAADFGAGSAFNSQSAPASLPVEQTQPAGQS